VGFDQARQHRRLSQTCGWSCSALSRAATGGTPLIEAVPGRTMPAVPFALVVIDEVEQVV
jgi:hypothetical protein